MNTKTLLPTVLSLALSSCLLAACGGGGSNSMVRTTPPSPTSDPPSPPPDPPPPPTPSSEPCQSPVTANCTAVATYTLTWDEGTQMTGGRQSDHALTVKGTGWLNIHDGDYRFSGGTTIVEDATLVVWDNLTSDVHVTAPGTQGEGSPTLWLGGTINGNVVNDGIVSLRHLCGTSCVEERHPVINGDFTQSASGRLEVVPGWSLQVTGKTTLDGELRFINSSAQNYVLPSAPASILVLHADGGVSGKFADWKSYELFLTGALRYLPNDIYFDATSISAVQAMTASARRVDPLTLGSAANFDAALANADKWADKPDVAFTTTQRQFLTSVGAVQHVRDYNQAIRTLDSLSGHGYAAAADTLLLQATLPAPELMARIGNLPAGSGPGSWATQTAMLASGAGVFSGKRTGLDQWLDDRTLLGSSFGWSDGSLRFDRAGGAAHDQSPQWDIYWRHDSSGNAYVFGDVGYSRHQLDFNRSIDLGITQQLAGSRRSLDVMRAYVETGRDYRIGATRLTPFGGVSYAALHGAGFAEQGSTGFELIGQPATYQRLTAVAGLRLGTEWRAQSGRSTTLNLTTGYRQLLHAEDNARAAFTGDPSATFALAGMPLQRSSGWLQMNLATGGERWQWLLSYDRLASDQAWSLGTIFRF